MTKVIRTIEDWQEERAALEAGGLSLGFVPTMGALHAGHRALLEQARAENDRVVLSIFVNPTQFDDPNDLRQYPRTLNTDVKFAQATTDYVLYPEPAEIYPDGFRYRVNEHSSSEDLEGVHRPGHFEGVLTVVLKLLNLVGPRRAYFGEKDWQQLQLVQGMARAFFLPVEIVACPTVREEDGLAMSSRNRRLSPEARARAPTFPRILREAANADRAVRDLVAAGFGVDYVEDREGRRLAAVRLEKIRLIDNVRI
ncbi:MAG TPA: pantoate--beta-alanine ligase [Opitutaceae bacterium]|jgi:pantoate--beta-alanine ligase